MRSLVHRSALTELLRQQPMREQDGEGDDNSSSDASERGEADGLAEVSNGLSFRPSVVKPLNKARQRHQPQPPIGKKGAAQPNGTHLPMKVTGRVSDYRPQRPEMSKECNVREGGQLSRTSSPLLLSVCVCNRSATS